MGSASKKSDVTGTGLIISALAVPLLFVSMSLLVRFPILDMRFYLNSIQVYDIIGGLTSSQVKAYRIMLGLDFIFPLAYGSFLFFFILLIYQRILKIERAAPFLLPLPLLAVLADYAENISILRILQLYPQASEIARWVGIFTTLKWSVLILAALACVTGLIILLIRKSGFFGTF